VTTAQQVLDFEGARLGQGGDETWGWYPLSRGTAWCCAFQSMALTSCGIPTHYAWVSALFDDYRSQGRNFYDIRTAQPGDLVAFEWGSTAGGYDHVAMIIGLTESGAWTRNGNVNGSKIADLWFPFDGGGMAEIARPPYTNPPEPEEEMKSILLVDRRKTPAPVYHAFGNTKVWLSKQEQVDLIRFFGAETVDPAPAAWLDALATLPRNDV
jgi:hypothetical protein